MPIIGVSEKLHNVKNAGPTLYIGKVCCFKEKKQQEKSIHYSNTLLIHSYDQQLYQVSSLNAELNPICHLLALLGVHFLHVNRIRVKSLTLRLLMSYIYIYDISSLRVNKRLDGHQKQSGLFWSRDTDLEYFGYRYEIPRTPGT